MVAWGPIELCLVILVNVDLTTKNICFLVILQLHLWESHWLFRRVLWFHIYGCSRIYGVRDVKGTAL